MSPVYTAQIEVYAVPGNHEYWCDSADSCTSAWEQAMVPTFPPGRTDNPAMPGREFSFVHRNALFIGLDQNQFGPSFPAYYRGNSIDWIEDRLAERDVSLQPHVVVFGHMPQFMTQWVSLRRKMGSIRSTRLSQVREEPKRRLRPGTVSITKRIASNPLTGTIISISSVMR